jgi:hypothetical protein
LLLKTTENQSKKCKNLSNKIIKIPQKNFKNQIKLVQLFSDFSENMKNFKKKKFGLNDGILDFEGRSPVRSPFYGSLDP